MAKTKVEHTTFEVKDFKMEFSNELTAQNIIDAAKIKSKNKNNREITFSMISEVPKEAGVHTIHFQNSFGDTAEIILTLTEKKSK